MENKTDDLELRPELTMAEFEERIAADRRGLSSPVASPHP